jgi:hypothetical protein
VGDHSRPDPNEHLAERQSSVGGPHRPWRPAADIASEIARLRPHLAGLADELRACLTDTPEDAPH